MKLFLYYAFHSTVNTIKKLLKTWVAIILAIVVAGALIGVVAGSIANLVEKKQAEKIENEIEEVTKEDEEGDVGFNLELTFENAGMTQSDIVDLVASMTILLIFATSFLSSKSTGNLFKPGDVVMLFSAPMKPQTVMLYRVVCSLGMMIFVGFYMIFQVPNLVMNVGMNLPAALALVVAYVLVMFFATLFQVTFYTIFSKVDILRRNMYTIIAGIYGLIIVGLIIYMKLTGQEFINASLHYFTGSKTFWVPFWGWLRAFCYYAVEGELLKSLMFFGLIAVGCAALVAVIWNLDADFYEDAIGSVEKMAQKMDNAKLASTSGTVKRKKDRRASLKREGFEKGFGANVFLYKALYNRNRFAKFRIFTTTSLVYIGIAVLVSYFCKEIKDFNPFFIVGGAFTLAVFYRTIGNPLEEDTSREFFLMIPEKTIKKLFYSYCGGLINTFLDLIIPFVIASVMLKADVFMVIGWLLFVLSVDYFGTSVGTFIAVSIPFKEGTSIKQMVQIMFIYFGVFPALVCLILGVIFEKMLLFGVIAALFDVAAGSLFFFLIPVFLNKGTK